MEANIENYVFKLDSVDRRILVYERDEMNEPYSFISIDDENLTEKEFHFEISDWYMQYMNK
jgi:hypothetical protein|tara:strand:- start:983 stop:1165 length:183 start_codon:yes stop_codon:yes gene_type:complete